MADLEADWFETWQLDKKNRQTIKGIWWGENGDLYIHGQWKLNINKNKNYLEIPLRTIQSNIIL